MGCCADAGTCSINVHKAISVKTRTIVSPFRHCPPFIDQQTISQDNSLGRPRALATSRLSGFAKTLPPAGRPVWPLQVINVVSRAITSALPPIPGIIAASHRLASYQSDPRGDKADRRERRRAAAAARCGENSDWNRSQRRNR